MGISDGWSSKLLMGNVINFYHLITTRLWLPDANYSLFLKMSLYYAPVLPKPPSPLFDVSKS